jgi:glycosyltransferase involved in cell wall biosynthesis
MSSLPTTVAICTYNRAQSLARTLDSLVAQTEIDWACVDIIVVDNNCTDDTPAVVDAFRERLPIRRVTENRQGLAHARNRAVAEFRGDILLFTDDDVRFDACWLAAYQDAIHRFSDADYFGGRILPDWGNAKPRWIRDKPLPLIDGVLVWFDQGVKTRLFETTEPPPFGASFAVRRRLFDKVGMFRVDLGTGGMGLGRGEETEFLTRARGTGAKGVYVGEALCFHAYDRARLTPAALYRYGIACGRSHNAIAEQLHRGGYGKAAWSLVRAMVQLLKGRGDRFRQCVINAGIEMGTRSSKVPLKVSTEVR